MELDVSQKAIKGSLMLVLSQDTGRSPVKNRRFPKGQVGWVKLRIKLDFTFESGLNIILLGDFSQIFRVLLW